MLEKIISKPVLTLVISILLVLAGAAEAETIAEAGQKIEAARAQSLKQNAHKKPIRTSESPDFFQRLAEAAQREEPLLESLAESGHFDLYAQRWPRDRHRLKHGTDPGLPAFLAPAGWNRAKPKRFSFLRYGASMPRAGAPQPAIAG